MTKRTLDSANLISMFKHAIKNDREFVILRNTNFYLKDVFRVLIDCGFIQSFEVKKSFIIVRLKQTY
jgi:ribosomal protein S8